MPQSFQQTRRTAKKLFRWCLVKGVVDERRVRQAVQNILSFRRRGYISLLEELQRRLKLERQQHTATVESALALTFGFQTHVRESLESSHGPGVITVFAPNPSLIGGIRIQIGSDVYDSSVRGRLVAIARTFGIEPTGTNAGARH